MTTPLPNLSALREAQPAATATLVGPTVVAGKRGPPLLTVKIFEAAGSRKVFRCLFRFSALSLQETPSDIVPAEIDDRRDELIDGIERVYDYLILVEETLLGDSSWRDVVLTAGPRYEKNAVANAFYDLWRRVFWVLDVEVSEERFRVENRDDLYTAVADELIRIFTEVHGSGVYAFQLEEDYGDFNSADDQILKWYEAQLR